MTHHQPEHAAVQTTVETRAEAEALAGRILEAKLAACVQITEITSFYRWDGAVQQDPEQLLTCKTAGDVVIALKEHIAAEHPYDEPELIVLPITGGSTGYLDWLVAETR